MVKFSGGGGDSKIPPMGNNVRRPKVVTSAHTSVRAIVMLAVIFENSFVEAKEQSFLK